MNDLRAYLISKAMWDPYVDEQKCREEFLQAVYGNAAASMNQYLETVRQAVEEGGRHLYCFNHPDKPWHRMELVETCETIFEEAKKAADNEKILHRIRMQEMAVRYLRIMLTPKGSDERNTLIEQFVPDMKAFGITMLWERENADVCIAILRGEREPGYWWPH